MEPNQQETADDFVTFTGENLIGKFSSFVQ